MKLTSSTSLSNSGLQIMVVVAVIFVAYFFGIRGIAQDPIRRDESTTMGHIGAMERDGGNMTVPDTWTSLLTYSGEHPPLYYSSANIWGHVVSYDYRIQRVLSLFWGILALAVVYRIGADVASKQVGLWSIAILATFTLYQHYLHEIREYSTLLFWASAVWLVYLRCISIRKSLTKWYLGALAVATSGALFSHPTAMFLLIGMGLYHLLFVPKNKRWWQVSIAVIIGGLTFSLWLPGLFSGVTTFNDRLAEGEDKTLYNPQLIPEVALFWGNGNPILFVGLLVTAGVAAIRDQRGSRKLWFFAIVVAIGYLGLNSYFPFIKRLRYVLVFAIPYTLLAGVALHYLSRLLRWQMIPLVVLALWIGVGSNFYRTLTFTDAVGTTSPQSFTEYHELMPLLESVSEPGLVMVNVVYDVATMKDSKQGKMGIDEYYQSQFDIRNRNIRADSNTKIVPEQVIEFIEDEPEFWLNYFHTRKISQVEDFQEKIAPDFVICAEYEYGVQSILVHYVAVDQEDDLCGAQVG